MADETIIVDKIGTLFLGGPPLVQAATGEVVTPDELGGATLHCDVSGCTDYFAVSEEDAIEQCKDVMASLNTKVYLQDEKFVEEPMFPTEELQALAVPYADKSNMMIYKILARIVDGSRFREFKPSFGPTLVTGFANISGILSGIVANNGPLSCNACLKGAHFIELCCQRDIPIIFLHNTQGATDIGYEQEAILIKEKAKMMSIIANSRVPKISLIIGNSYGIDNSVMCGRSMGPRFVYMWPAARIAIDSPQRLPSEGEWNMENSGVEDNLVNQIEEQSTSIYSTGRLWDDGVILPQDTRNVLKLSLQACLRHRKIEHSSKSVIRM